MEAHYLPKSVEETAQQYWEKKQSFQVQADISKEKFYCLAMIPYPSGSLHVGHVRNYTLSDVIARYQRMLGKNVLQPIAWDAFGLPAENAALTHNIAPAKWTYENIDRMREQFKSLGLAYDWTREFATCDPNYYRWEQWLFLKLFKKGLAYKKLSTVNWDPVDQTVLANEQVIDGKGWRSGADVERRDISQWFLKITDYADELLDGLDQLTEWPEQVRRMQKNWIGRSEGLEIQFKLADRDEQLTVYTTRVDTLFGVTYLCISPEHALAKEVAEHNPEIAQCIEACNNVTLSEADMATQEKIGINTGLSALHPITGGPIQIWIANYVLNSYGSGAVMAVPAHDQRDFEFANQYKLPKMVVIATQDGTEPDLSEQAFTEKGPLINSDQYNGLDYAEAFSRLANDLSKNNLATRTVKYRLRDWGVSRQRYWGAPIPIIHCDQCGNVAVPDEDLPVVLPEKVDCSKGPISLKDIPEFYKTICPECGNNATRETDTFDTFMESSWYYARLNCTNQDNEMLDDRAKYWTPVDQYVGGVEHAVMHLLYARFMHKLLRDEGLLNTDEPFVRLLTQGMVLKDGAKMSKSKGNTVDPDALIQRYGADSVRVFAIFTAPPEQSLEWSDSGFEGSHRFLKRLWSFSAERKDDITSTIDPHIDWDRVDSKQSDTWREMHLILQQVTNDYDRLQLNTVVSGCMKLFNLLLKLPDHTQQAGPAEKTNRYLLHHGTKILLSILSPIAPHICHVLWKSLNFGGAVITASWPQASTAAMEAKSISYVIQVNGKLRTKLAIPSGTEQSDIENTALTDLTVKKHLGECEIAKIIFIPNRLINIVTKR
jgi:leucyl-tRNA synthetase